MDAIEAEIWNIIKLSPVKSCELDPLPTWLLKECKAELVPLITDIVNVSLREYIPYFELTGHPVPVFSLGFVCPDCFILNCSYMVYPSKMKRPFRYNCLGYFYL